MDDKCESVGSCKAIKRLIVMLRWYAQVNGDHEQIMQALIKSTYDKYIVDDYQHLLNYHLIHKYQINTTKEYQLIQNEIAKHIEPCDRHTCPGYKRYHELSKKNLSKSDDYEFCQDFVDLIHCYLMHSKHLH